MIKYVLALMLGVRAWWKRVWDDYISFLLAFLPGIMIAGVFFGAAVSIILAVFAGTHAAALAALLTLLDVILIPFVYAIFAWLEHRGAGIG